MKLSIVIPSRNEAGSLPGTITSIKNILKRENINHEIVVINDGSIDKTDLVLKEISKSVPELKILNNGPQNGFGLAVRKGLENFSGDCVAIMMADMSDSPDDLVSFFYTLINEDVDCVFGDRFSDDGQIKDYPKNKLFFNRIANMFLRIVFNYSYGDTTNAFKLYSRKAVEKISPLTSSDFSLTIEMPLKAIIRGCKYKVLPNSWENRKDGVSKFKIWKMFRSYFGVVVECVVEKYLKI